jgi:hypothetical protein
LKITAWLPVSISCPKEVRTATVAVGLFPNFANFVLADSNGKALLTPLYKKLSNNGYSVSAAQKYFVLLPLYERLITGKEVTKLEF